MKSAHHCDHSAAAGDSVTCGWASSPGPHATFGVIVVVKVPQVEPVHFQSCLEDPRAGSRGEEWFVYLLFTFVSLHDSSAQTF